MSKEEKGFHFVYVTEEDAKRELEETISNLSEDKKSDFKFKGEYFYEIGSGHDFVHGFFMKYVTKKGVQATDYSSYWVINGGDYNLKDGVFIETPKVEAKPIDWSEVKLPIVKNVKSKTIGEDLESVKPFAKYRK
jgi:hypothetical protein